MRALAPARLLPERGGEQIDMRLGGSRVELLHHPGTSYKAILASVRQSAREILRLVDTAGTAVGQPERNMVALGIALHADDVVGLARQLGETL